MDTLLTDEQIADALHWRVCEGKYWEWIAASLKVDQKTVYNARQTERWQELALELIKEIKAEAFPVAWQGLLGAAAAGDVAACKEILNRVDKVLEQPVNLKVSGEVEIKDNEYAALLAELAGISTNGTPDKGSGDA